MVINRENYETVFLLYLDNELAAQERLAVESFLKDHPDLQVEFELLRDTFLSDDALPEFSGKESLYRNTSQVTTEKLLLLLDQELAGPEAASLYQKIAGSEGLSADFSVLQQTRLDSNDTVIYPWKEQLYRKEPARVVGFRKWQLAAAAVLALALLWSGIRYFRQTTGSSLTETASHFTDPARQNKISGVPSENAQSTESAPGQSGSESVSEAPYTSDHQVIDGADQRVIQPSHSTATVNPGNVASTYSNGLNNNGDAGSDSNGSNVNATALNVKNQTGSNVLETPSVNTLNAVDTRASDAATTMDPVVRETPASYLVQTSFSEPAEPLGSFEDGDESKPKKGKLRGLLKRMKRVVERNAHIGNSEGEIKVANLSFAAN